MTKRIVSIVSNLGVRLAHRCIFQWTSLIAERMTNLVAGVTLSLRTKLIPEPLLSACSNLRVFQPCLGEHFPALPFLAVFQVLAVAGRRKATLSSSISRPDLSMASRTSRLTLSCTKRRNIQQASICSKP